MYSIYLSQIINTSLFLFLQMMSYLSDLVEGYAFFYALLCVSVSIVLRRRHGDQKMVQITENCIFRKSLWSF